MPSYDGDGFDPPAPVAFVTLRNPLTGKTATNTPMLLDSGADVTLIPMAAARSLDLSTEGQPQYELVGVEGANVHAQAVWLEMQFLRRTYRGQFLLVRQDWGVIGRNVLNTVALLLDGPAQGWEEQKPGESSAPPRP